MRRAAALALMLAACAVRLPPVEYAPTALRGPRIASMAGQADDVEELQLRLWRSGFQFVKDDDPSARVRFVVDGVCGVSGVIDPTLKVEGFDGATKERVFLATVTRPVDCPTAFYEHVVEALNRLWPAR